jgi:hypothetical protein
VWWPFLCGGGLFAFRRVFIMAKKAAKVATLSINSVALATYIDNFSLKVDQETPVTTQLGDTGPRRVTGNYDHSLDLSGKFDGASGAVDATLFGLIASAGVASDLGPTGAAAGANDPHYTSTNVLASYSISGQVGGAVEYQATLPGTAALTRQVS